MYAYILYISTEARIDFLPIDLFLIIVSTRAALVFLRTQLLPHLAGNWLTRSEDTF